MHIRTIGTADKLNMCDYCHENPADIHIIDCQSYHYYICHTCNNILDEIPNRTALTRYNEKIFFYDEEEDEQCD